MTMHKNTSKSMKRDTLLNAKAHQAPRENLPGLCTRVEEEEEVRVVQNLRPWNRQCGCHVHTSVKHVSLKVWLYKRSWEANTINKLVSLHKCSRCTAS